MGQKLSGCLLNLGTYGSPNSKAPLGFEIIKYVIQTLQGSSKVSTLVGSRFPLPDPQQQQEVPFEFKGSPTLRLH